MTKNRAPTPVYLDPGMHSGLEVKGLRHIILCVTCIVFINRHLEVTVRIYLLCYIRTFDSYVICVQIKHQVFLFDNILGVIHGNITKVKK